MNLSKASIIAILYITLIAAEKKNWTYELKSIKATSTDTNVADIGVEQKRIDRGLYAFTGFLDFKNDLDDSTVVDVRVYRSSTGRDEDYRVTPFIIEDEILTNFMNVHYKSYIMESIKSCAPAAPQFEGDDEFEAPMPKSRIELEDCLVPTDGFPNLMEDGFYKVAAYARNDIEMYLEIVVEVERL